MAFFEGKISKLGFEENDFFFICTNKKMDLEFNLEVNSESKLRLILSAFHNEDNVGISYDENKKNSRFFIREFFIEKKHIEPSLSLETLFR